LFHHRKYADEQVQEAAHLSLIKALGFWSSGVHASRRNWKTRHPTPRYARRRRHRKMVWPIVNVRTGEQERQVCQRAKISRQPPSSQHIDRKETQNACGGKKKKKRVGPRPQRALETLKWSSEPRSTLTTTTKDPDGRGL
jgi:hypothetical protein